MAGNELMINLINLNCVKNWYRAGIKFVNRYILTILTKYKE
jgi:hypothetical protein